MGFGRQLDPSEDEYMHHAFCSRHLLDICHEMPNAAVHAARPYT